MDAEQGEESLAKVGPPDTRMWQPLSGRYGGSWSSPRAHLRKSMNVVPGKSEGELCDLADRSLSAQWNGLAARSLADYDAVVALLSGRWPVLVEVRTRRMGIQLGPAVAGRGVMAPEVGVDRHEGYGEEVPLRARSG